MYNPAFQGHGQRRIAGLLGSASIRALIFGGAFVVGMDSAQADPLTWDAGNPNGDVTIEPGNGNWNSDAANLVWFNPVAAGADAFQTGDDVFFTDPLSGGPFTVTMTQGVRIGSMTFDAAGYTIVPSNPGLRIFSNGASSGIITNGNATIESALRGTFDLSGTATLTLNSSSSLDYRLNIMSGTVVNTGDLTNTGGVGSARVVNFGGTFTNTGTIENYGQVLGFGNFEGTANGNITLNGGSFDLTNTLAVSGAFVNNLTTPIVVDNDLTVNSFQNSGMTQVDMGSTLTIAGAGQVFNNKTGATLDINAGGTVDGSIVHTGLALIVGGSVTGDVDANADMTLESTGDIDGELAVGAGATAAAEGGTVDTVVVENGAIFDLTTPGSTVTVDGTGAGAEFDLQAGGTLTTTSGGAVMLDVTEDFASAGAINGGAGASQLTIQAATIDLNTGTTFAGNEVILLGNIENAVTLTFGTGYTLAGTLLNETGGTVNFNAAMNAGGFDITNTGTATLNVNPTGSITNAGTIALQNASTMAIDAGASVQATVINNTGSGLLTVDGTATTDVNNTGTGTVDVNATGAITGTLTNNARATLAGNVGAIDNQGSGDLDFDGTMTVAGNVANAGMVDVNGGVIVTVNGATGTTNTGTGLLTVNGTLISDVVNRNMATVTVNDTLTGNLTNDDMGRVNLAGTVNGNVTNVTIDNTLNVTGPSTITGDFDTAGQTKVMADLTVTGAATNRADAVLDVDAGRTLTNAAVQNAGDVILGGTIAGSLFNVTADSKLTVDGAAAITGNLNTLGDVDISAANSLAVAGDILSEAEFTANGNLSWGPLSTFTNTAAGTLALNGVMATGRTLNNAGRLTFGNGTLVNAAINSTGTMDVTGNVILNGAVTQSGLVDLQQMAGMTNDVLNVTGPANFNGSVFRLDSELAGGGSSSDQIIVSGALTGDFQLAFNAIGSPIAGQSTTILQFAGATSVFSYTQTGLEASGALVYQLTRDNAAGTVILESGANPSLGGLVGAVSLTQSLIGSVVNRPSSPFVAGLAVPGDDPCGAGAWGRLTGGSADATGSARSPTSGGGEILVDSVISAQYAGIQLGTDFSCFNGYYGGWDLSFGGIIGLNQGITTQPNFAFNPVTGTVTQGAILSTNTTDFTQTYGGLYLSAYRDNLLLDLQYRVDSTDYDLSNDGATANDRLGILDQSFSSQSSTLSLSGSYQFDVNKDQGISFVPTIGYAYSQISTDSLDFAGNATLDIQDSTTEIGFLGATLAKAEIDPDGKSALIYFATATYYEDFAPDTRALYNDPAAAIPVESFSSNLGQYGELSLGVNYTRLLDPGQLANGRQLNASVRVDGKYGENLESWGVTAQMRMQF